MPGDMSLLLYLLHIPWNDLKGRSITASTFLGTQIIQSQTSG